MMGRQFATFLVVGAANTLAGLAVIFGCLHFLDLPPLAANAAGYAVGLVVSFLLNGKFTFQRAPTSGAALVRFLLVIGVAYLANAAAVLALSPVNRYLAQVAGMAIYTTLSFAGCRQFVFRRREPIGASSATSRSRQRPLPP